MDKLWFISETHAIYIVGWFCSLDFQSATPLTLIVLIYISNRYYARKLMFVVEILEHLKTMIKNRQNSISTSKLDVLDFIMLRRQRNQTIFNPLFSSKSLNILSRVEVTLSGIKLIFISYERMHNWNRLKLKTICHVQPWLMRVDTIVATPSRIYNATFECIYFIKNQKQHMSIAAQFDFLDIKVLSETQMGTMCIKNQRPLAIMYLIKLCCVKLFNSTYTHLLFSRCTKSYYEHQVP